MLERIRTEKILKLDSNWKFEYIISFIFVLFGIIGWQFEYAIGASLVIVLSIFLILIYKKIKYSIPAILVLLFSIGEGFEVSSFPFKIVIPIAIYVIFLICFAIYNFKKEKLKNIKAIIGMSILSISFIIPIFWTTVIDSSNSIFYLMYFSWLLYTLLYVILCIIIEKDSFRILTFSMSFLSILLVYELGITVLKWHFDNPGESIFSFWGYVGWGLCNEVGIVLCFIMPFLFYELVKSNNYYLSLISILKIGILLGGIVLTTSRGTYACGFVEAFILTIISFILKQKLKLFKIIIILSIVLIAIIGVSFKFNLIDAFNKIKDKVFYMDFGLNDRDVIWNSGAAYLLDSYRNLFFGSGIVTELHESIVFDQMQVSFLIYHSTTMEVFVSAGIIGLVGIGIHFFEKYKMLFKKNISFLLIFFTGYLMVDLYGLIDNTYGMYYYMVPLVITMATINNSTSFELFQNEA